jgi:hypothetical protein
MSGGRDHARVSAEARPLPESGATIGVSPPTPPPRCQDKRGRNFGERDDMVVGSKRAVAGLVGSIVGMIALVLFPVAAVADPTGVQATLTAVSGTGSGRVLIAPSAKLHGRFAAAVTINVHGASPDMTYVVTRYPDLPPADGICARDLGPRPTGVLDTSASGAGAAHFDLQPPPPTPFVSGTSFDVVWVLVGSDGSELVSECVTVTVK